MSNRSSSKQHGHAQSRIQRPKSVLRKKNNKAQARVLRAERQEKNNGVFAKALAALKSAF